MQDKHGIVFFRAIRTGGRTGRLVSSPLSELDCESLPDPSALSSVSSPGYDRFGMLPSVHMTPRIRNLVGMVVATVVRSCIYLNREPLFISLNTELSVTHLARILVQPNSLEFLRHALGGDNPPLYISL
jgi:hypothetical protein